MSKHTSGLHHFHIRKRVYQDHEPYPHPDRLKRFMDKAIYLVGVLGPLSAIPQLVEIWINKNAGGLSLFMWVSWTILALFWLTYGIVHKEWPIILTYTGWILIDVGVVVGVLLYS